MKTITEEEAVARVKALGPDEEATISFIKRKPRERRLMRFRLRPPPDWLGPVSSGRRAYDPEAKCLTNVFDLDKEDWRCFNWEGLEWLELTGAEGIVVRYIVEHGENCSRDG
jgi:hypothetical protein